VEAGHHRRVALALSLTAAHYVALPPLGVAVAAATAWAAGSGPASPDADNTPDAHDFDTAVPDEWLGNGGPLGHRRLAHWWGIPAAAWWWWHDQPLIAPAELGWACTGLWQGWVSHLLADFIWGRAARGRGPGIPFAPWWWHWGAGLNPKGPSARVGSWAAVAVAVYAALTIAGPLAPYWIGGPL
jgi:hypothetical protein